MTFSVFLMILFKQNISLSSIMSVNIEPQYDQTQKLLHVLVFVFGMTLTFEILGAGLLFWKFKDLHSIPYAAYSAVFHAISAFCNAGFSLYPTGLIRFQHDVFVPAVFMALIILGGLGFMLIDEIRVWLWCKARREPMRLSLHTRICLSVTLILILLGAAFIFLLERGNLLEGMPLIQQMVNAFFMSVTARTAGFNMLEIPSLTNATLFFLMWLMFIGACPGSTAGGIKVTTIAVLFSLVRSKLYGVSTYIFNRNIPTATMIRSLSLFAAGLSMVTVATFLFLMSEHIGVSHLESRGSFLDQLFEVTSAFGTVGLSTGITSTLTGVGKLFVILIMFAGRVGPLTFGVLFLAGKNKPVYHYVDEDVVIG